MRTQYAIVKLGSDSRRVRNFKTAIDDFGLNSSDDIKIQRTFGKLIFENKKCWRDCAQVDAGEIAYRPSRIMRCETNAVPGAQSGDFQHLGVTAGVFDIRHHDVEEPALDIRGKPGCGYLAFGTSQPQAARIRLFPY